MPWEIDRDPHVNGHDFSGGSDTCRNCGMTRQRWAESWQTCPNPKPPAPPQDRAAVRGRIRERIASAGSERLRTTEYAFLRG